MGWSPLKRQILVQALFLAALPLQGECQSDRGANAFVSMSLEELLDVTVYGREPLGLHHTHPAGEWMFGLSFAAMKMSELSEQGTELHPQGLFARGFDVAPLDMSSRILMLEVMYGVSDRLTVMAMLPRKGVAMRHRTRTGGEFETSTAGIGDLSTTALIELFSTGGGRADLTARLTLPTGTVHARDETPANSSQKLPYAMQLGTGSVGTLLGFTYSQTGHQFSGGFNLSFSTALGRNELRYRHERNASFEAWLTHQWTNQIATHLRGQFTTSGGIQGSDPELVPTVVPTADPANHGGDQATIIAGISVFQRSGTFAGSRFTADVSLPAAQSLQGIQFKKRWRLRAGFAVIN